MTSTTLRPRPTARIVAAAALAVALSSALSGCYIVPLQPAPSAATPNANQFAVPPAPVTQSFGARLYPANEQATAYGILVGTVTSDLNGRGHFSTMIAGEPFQGEATRTPGSRNGVASASGSRGGMLNCQYQMNSTALGSGRCTLNSGPAFTMHIGG